MKSKFILLLIATINAGVWATCQVKPIAISGNILMQNILKDTLAMPVNTISPAMLVRPQFYTSNLAFFCRQEIKFEKITKIPFKFRLGSVQQVDYLEGKKNTSVLQ